MSLMIVNWKGYGRKQSWVLRYLLGGYKENHKKPLI
jgi:hypothetical protein